MRGFEATQGDAPDQRPARRRRGAVLQRPRRCRPRWRRRCAWAAQRMRRGDRPAHRDRPPRRARRRAAARRAGRHPRHRAPGQVPRRGRARHRPAPAAARARRRPVRPRGALRRAARRLRRDRRLRRGARDAVSADGRAGPAAAGHGRRGLGRLRPRRQRPRPQARALRPLPLHPPRSRRRCGRRGWPSGTPTASSSPARTRTAAAAGSSTARCPARRLAAGVERGPLHRAVHPVPPPRLLPRHGAGVGVDARAARRASPTRRPSTCSATPASARWR